MPSQINIDAHHLTLIKKILNKHLPSSTKIWVFGSRATNNIKPYSDLDLSLEDGKDKIITDTLQNLSADFEESDLPWKVDIVDLNNISIEFKNIILQNRILLNTNI